MTNISKELRTVALLLLISISNICSAGVISDAITNFIDGSLPPAAQAKFRQTIEEDKAKQREKEVAEQNKRNEEYLQRLKAQEEASKNKYVKESIARFDAKGDFENIHDLISLQDTVNTCLHNQRNCQWNGLTYFKILDLWKLGVPSSYYFQGIVNEAKLGPGADPGLAAGLYEKAANLGSAGGIHAYLRVRNSTVPLPGSDAHEMELFRNLLSRGDTFALKSAALKTPFIATTTTLNDVPIARVREVIASGQPWGYYLAGAKLLSGAGDDNADELLHMMSEGARRKLIFSSHQMMAMLVQYITSDDFPKFDSARSPATITILTDELKVGLKRNDPFAVKTLAILKAMAPNFPPKWKGMTEYCTASAALYPAVSKNLFAEFATINARDHLDSSYCHEMDCFVDHKFFQNGQYPTESCISFQEKMIMADQTANVVDLSILLENSYQELNQLEDHARKVAKYQHWCNSDKERCRKHEENIRAENEWQQEFSDCIAEAIIIQRSVPMQARCYGSRNNHELPYPDVVGPNY